MESIVVVPSSTILSGSETSVQSMPVVFEMQNESKSLRNVSHAVRPCFLYLRAEEKVELQLLHLNMLDTLNQKFLEILMGGSGERAKRSQATGNSKNDKQDRRGSKKRKTAQSDPRQTFSSESQGNIHVANGDNELDDNSTNDVIVEDNISETRKALEQVLIKLNDLEAKVDLIDKRVTEIQVTRSNASGVVEGGLVRKRSTCNNEKDSLFKEVYESSTGKLKVSHAFKVLFFKSCVFAV